MLTAVDLGGQTASVVDARRTPFEENLAGGSIVDVPGIGAALLVDIKDLKTRTLRVEFGEVDGIAVAEAGGVEHAPVVVESRRSPQHLVVAVAVDIGHAEVVVAVGEECATALTARRSGCGVDAAMAQGVGDSILLPVARLVEPPRFKSASVVVDSPGEGVAVVAARENRRGTGIAASEVCDGSEITLTAVAVTAVVLKAMTGIAPDERTLGIAAETGVAVGIIEDGADGTAVGAAEDGEIFLSAVDAPLAVAPVAVVVGSADDGVVGGLVDVPPTAVAAPRCRLAHQFGTSVTVEIVDEKLRIVGSGADIRTEIDAPQSARLTGRGLHIELIAVEDHRPRHSPLRVVAGVGGFPLDDKLILAVAIDIADGAVVDGIVVVGTCCGLREVVSEVGHRPRQYGLRCRQHLAVDDSGYLPVAVGSTLDDGRGGSRHILHIRFAIAEDGERRRRSIGGQQSPRGEIRPRLLTLSDNKAAVEVLHRRYLCHGRKHRGCGHGGKN